MGDRLELTVGHEASVWQRETDARDEYVYRCTGDNEEWCGKWRTGPAVRFVSELSGEKQDTSLCES